MDRLGYIVTASECNTAEFGLPQQRARAWVLCVLKDESLPSVSSDMLTDLELFKCERLSLEKCISTVAKQSSGTEQKQTRAHRSTAVPKWHDAFKEERRTDWQGQEGLGDLLYITGR